MNKRFLSLIFLPLVVSNFNNSSAIIKNYVKSEVSREGAKVETNIDTKVNQTQTSIKVNKSGEVEVNVQNEKVEIKTSKGITPTIIITGIPTQNIKIEERVDQNQPKTKIFPVLNLIKDFIRKFFGIFKFSSEKVTIHLRQ